MPDSSVIDFLTRRRVFPNDYTRDELAVQLAKTTAQLYDALAEIDALRLRLTHYETHVISALRARRVRVRAAPGAACRQS